MRRTRGFTLIEIVLATTLFALLMSSYYIIVINVMTLEEVARSERSFGSIGPAVLDLVEDDLLSLYTHPREPKAFPFRGADDSLAGKPSDRLDFVTRRPSVHQETFWTEDWLRSPVNEVGYRLASPTRRRNGDVRTLYRREKFHVDDMPMEGGEYFEMYDRVVSLEVTYAGYRAEEEERSSLDELGTRSLDRFESWDSDERGAFPTAVILSLTIEPPQLTATIEVEGDTRSPEQRTFVRIVRLVQARDVPAPEVPEEGTPPGAAPGAPNSPGDTGDR